MYCKYCGQPISENSKYCSFCGKSQESRLRSRFVLQSVIQPLKAIFERCKHNGVYIKCKRLFARHKKVAIVSLSVLAVLVMGFIALIKIGSHFETIIVPGDARYPLDTKFGLQYDVVHCGFQGNNLEIQMRVTNNGKHMITVGSDTFDQSFRLCNVNTEQEYALNYQATAQYRMEQYKVNSLSEPMFSNSDTQNLRQGFSYEYDIVYTVSDESAQVSDFLLYLYSIGPGESANHYSHLYLFSLQYIQ